jgi:hypothetical protein
VDVEFAYFDQKLVNTQKMEESIVPFDKQRVIEAGKDSFAGFSTPVKNI